MVIPLHWLPLSFDSKRRKKRGEKLASSFPVHGTPAIPCHAIPDMCSLALLLPGCRGSPVFVRLLFVFPEGWERGDFSTSWTNKQQRARETKPGREHLPRALCFLIRHYCLWAPPPPSNAHWVELQIHTYKYIYLLHAHTYTQTHTLLVKF